MNNANDILTLLGIPGEKIKYFTSESDDKNSVIYIELVDEKGCCPECGSTSIEIKDYYIVRINNSVIKHKNMIVQIRVRRYRCKKCGKSFKQRYDFYEKGSSISNSVKQTILDDLKEKLTFTHHRNNNYIFFYRL